MPLLSRFAGSIIDKVLILIIFVVGFTIISMHHQQRLANILDYFTLNLRCTNTLTKLK